MVMKYATAPNAKVVAGGGDDAMLIGESALDSFAFNLGGGSDYLGIDLISGAGTANGGAGKDRLNVVDDSGLTLDDTSLEEFGPLI